MIYNSKLYDGDSIELMKSSWVKQFAQKDNFTRHNLPITDTGVTNAGSYLEYQLTYVVPRVLKRIYPATPALELFSVSNEGTLEKIILNRMKTFSGSHYREHEQKSNPNRGMITVAYNANGMRIEDFEASSEYKEIDLLRAAQMNDPLDASVIEAHDESYKTAIDNIAFLGMQDEQGNTLVEGLLNNSQVNSTVALNSTYTFDSASNNGVTMWNDLKKLYNALIALSGGQQMLWPDTIVTSPKVYGYLATTTYGTGTSSPTNAQNYKTIMQMLKEMLGITEIRATNRAVGLDTGTTDRLCMFNRKADNMMLYIPQPLKFSEVAKIKFNYSIDSMFRVAGLNIFRNSVFGYLKVC